MASVQSAPGIPAQGPMRLPANITKEYIQQTYNVRAVLCAFTR